LTLIFPFYNIISHYELRKNIPFFEKGKNPIMSKKNIERASQKKVNLLIYCTSELILSGILKAIEPAPDLEVINIEKSTIDSLLNSIKNLKPDIVLFTNSEPLPNIKEICKAIKGLSDDKAKSQLMLIGNIPSHEEVVSLINAGARGYFDLNDPSNQLAEAIRIIQKQEIWLPRDKMSSIMDRIISVVGRDLKEKTLDQLTPTEFQVLRLIGQGKSNDEIAEAMFISKNTVRSHIKSIYSKLDTHSRLQLALYAINSALF
jgi:NarL family two-component system response regulator LiaR